MIKFLQCDGVEKVGTSDDVVSVVHSATSTISQSAWRGQVSRLLYYRSYEYSNMICPSMKNFRSWFRAEFIAVRLTESGMIPPELTLLLSGS